MCYSFHQDLTTLLLRELNLTSTWSHQFMLKVNVRFLPSLLDSRSVDFEWFGIFPVTKLWRNWKVLILVPLGRYYMIGIWLGAWSQCQRNISSRTNWSKSLSATAEAKSSSSSSPPDISGSWINRFFGKGIHEKKLVADDSRPVCLLSKNIGQPGTFVAFYLIDIDLLKCVSVPTPCLLMAPHWFFCNFLDMTFDGCSAALLYQKKAKLSVRTSVILTSDESSMFSFTAKWLILNVFAVSNSIIVPNFTPWSSSEYRWWS